MRHLEHASTGRFRSETVPSFVISTLGATVVVGGFVVADDQMRHWFVVPLWCCGVLIGSDAVDWLRGKLDLFDPVAIIGVLGVHFFFLAPLLHVTWDFWMADVDPPPDWRDWLGKMALLNITGLLLYRSARHWMAGRGAHAEEYTLRHLDPGRLAWAAGVGLVISAVLQGAVYATYGGLSGYVDAYSDSRGLPEAQSAFAGMAWIFMVSESFPILAMLLFAVYAARTKKARGWIVIATVLLAYLVLKMIFGGFRGSRSHTIWAVFWAAGIIHLWVRPLSKRFVVVGACALVAFMYVYGFYKELRGDFTAAYEQGAVVDDTVTTGRTFTDLLLGDLGRADVQAFLLYRLSTGAGDYVYARGRTYVASLMLLMPRRIWPERPPTKVKEGTEAQFGVGSYDEDEWSSSRVYGLAGETMLNFGPFVVPFAYLVFGLIVGRLRRFFWQARTGDARLLLYPLALIFCFSILHADSDNLVFMLVKDGILPIAIVWWASHVLTWSPVPSRPAIASGATKPGGL